MLSGICFNSYELTLQYSSDRVVQNKVSADCHTGMLMKRDNYIGSDVIKVTPPSAFKARSTEGVRCPDFGHPLE